MRVLLLTNMYPPHHYGGYELSCHDTVTSFVAAGHEVVVLTSTIRVEGVVEDACQDGSVRRELQMYWHDHILLDPPLRQRFAIERSNLAALRRALETVRPDVVSVWNMGALSFSLLTELGKRRLPVVFVMGDDWAVYGQVLDAWSRLFRGWARSVGTLITRTTGFPTTPTDFTELGPCLFNSEAMRQDVRHSSGYSVPRAAIVHPGVSMADFSTDTSGPPQRCSTWSGQLLYVGRIDERKGVDTAVRAIAELPGAHLKILGRGDDSFRVRLQQLSCELGVDERVQFGVVSRAALAMEYKAADALLFTSVYREPFGIVPLEAMACDTPVIATGVGGSGEYLQHESNCLIYEPGSPVSLADAIRRLSLDEALRIRLVEGGRETSLRLTAEAYATNLLEWHLAVASGLSSPRA